MPTQRIKIGNDVTLGLVVNGEAFGGIGEVTVGDIPLHHPKWPMHVDIESPDGGTLCNYTVEDQRREGDRCVLTLRAMRGEQHLAEWMVHEVRPLRNTRHRGDGPSELPHTRLELELRPVERVFGGRRHVGFSYRYRYQSEEMPIYRLVDRSAWAIDGSCLGNAFWMRTLFARPIHEFQSASDRFSTSWRLPRHRNPIGFQFAPLQTELQGFTFTDCEHGVLVTWPTRVAHIRSLFEKPADTDAVFHWHEHCQDLAFSLDTSPVEVLFHAASGDRVERINHYESVKETVHAELHEQIGMRRERVTTFGMMEEWSEPDLGRYRERGLPALVDANIETVELANHFQHNTNVYAAPTMCCTLDWRFPDEATRIQLKQLCSDADEHDVKIMHWGNTALSTLGLILDRQGLRKKFSTRGMNDSNGDGDTIWNVVRRAQEPFIRNPSGAYESDHYAPEFAAVNLRDPDMVTYWLECWREAARRVGFRGIFLDSSFNLSSDKFHYCLNPNHVNRGVTLDQVDQLEPDAQADMSHPQILSQYMAHLNLMVEMQRLGYVYCGEDCGVFGVHRHGPSCSHVLDNLFMWTDTVLNFDPKEIESVGADPDDVFFRGLALRVMWLVHWLPDADCLSFRYGKLRDARDQPREWHRALLGVHRRFERFMLNRQVADGGDTVVYHDVGSGVRMIWACGETALTTRSHEQVCDLVEDALLDTDASGQFMTAPHRVYLLAESAALERLRATGRQPEPQGSVNLTPRQR